jgi:Amt family ammonium transporter
VAITPAAGFVGPVGAIVMGLLAGAICLWGVNGLKRMLGADDSSTCSACMASAASSVPS